MYTRIKLILVKEFDQNFNIDFAGIHWIHELEDGFYVFGRDPPEFAIGIEASFEIFKSKIVGSNLMKRVVIFKCVLNFCYFHVTLR